MSSAYRQLWESLGLDLGAHDQLRQAMPPTYGEVYLSQENRPEKMEYFDFVVAEIHGQRIQELQEHKARGGKVIGTFYVFVPEEIIRGGRGNLHRSLLRSGNRRRPGAKSSSRQHLPPH
ncbi:MAG: hypothetical protein AB1523_13265 [Bacillota bacterium]